MHSNTSSRYQIINLLKNDSTDSFPLDVLNGLSQTAKMLPSKYLYDKRGSLLFEQIMELEEYYPTRCELEILTRCKQEIREIASQSIFRLVELGVGDARKTKIIVNDFLAHGIDFEYVLIDYCEEMVLQVVDSLKNDFQNSSLKVKGIVADYSAALNWLSNQEIKRNIVLFLGSSIGNFNGPQTHDFLHQLWNVLSEDDCVFIGFDLKKNMKLLEKAYNDSKGLTREFNFNILDRMNKELNANFNRNHFIHHSFYNPQQGRMESWLLSTISQKVDIRAIQKSFYFQAWEGIHLENSYKYDIIYIEKLAETIGFTVNRELLDDKGYFAEAIWNVKKNI